jgi:hypothetical protein
VDVQVVIMNLAKTSPAKFTLLVRLPGAPNASNMSQPPRASRLFANGGYDVEYKCRKDCVEGLLEDWVGAGDTIVYEIGCTGIRAANGQPWQSCANRRVSCSDFMWGCSHVALKSDDSDREAVTADFRVHSKTDDGSRALGRFSLHPPKFAPLPLWELTTTGWLRRQMDLAAHGLAGNEHLIWPWLSKSQFLGRCTTVKPNSGTAFMSVKAGSS